MIKDVKKKEEIDDALLLVSGKSVQVTEVKDYIKKLANASILVFNKHSVVHLRCVGAPSINNGIKSSIIAKGEAEKIGKHFLLDPSFTMVTFDGEEKTGIILEFVEKEIIEKKKIEEKKEVLLLVSGAKANKNQTKEYIKKLANAILQVYSKYETVCLRCVGAASLNNGVKSFIIAKGEAEKIGKHFLLDPSFTVVEFDGEEKTGIVLEAVSC